MAAGGQVMKQTAMADRGGARETDDEDRGRDPDLLRREADSRDGRIKMRREQQRKKELARKLAKRKRMFKVGSASFSLDFWRRLGFRLRSSNGYIRSNKAGQIGFLAPFRALTGHSLAPMVRPLRRDGRAKAE